MIKVVRGSVSLGNSSKTCVPIISAFGHTSRELEESSEECNVKEKNEREGIYALQISFQC